jgi:hypothetical protein
MSTRTRLCVLATLTLLGTAVPAFAQAVPDDANKALWCSTAFTLVEPQARAAGDATAADKFSKYAATLTGTSGASLKQAGFTDDQIKTTAASYKDKVTKELSGGGVAEFTVIDCTMLVDPSAAAAIQQQQAPAAAPAPDAAAPAAPARDATPAPDATPATPAPAN